MLRVVTPSQMKSAERKSEDIGISCGVLMDNVGRMCAEKTDRIFDIKGKKAVVICGVGNNGGDGYTIARNLKKYKCKAYVITMGMPHSELALSRYEYCKPSFDSKTQYTDKDEVRKVISSADIIFDCVYGTGFHGELEPQLVWLFSLCEKSSAVKIAVDIASGCNAETGKAADGAFKADITYALGAVKSGQLYIPCSIYSGKIIPIDIGIENECYDEYEAKITEKDVLSEYPERVRISHKGNYGKLLIVAGSERCIGAAWLASNAALRTGAGLVTLCSVKAVTNSVANTLHECVYMPISGDEEMKAEYAGKIAEAAKSATAVVIGCGMGNSDDTLKIITEVIKNSNCPILIDADGINSLAMHKHEVKDNNRIILTPHIKEFSRLTGKSTEEISGAKLTLAKEFAKEYGVHVLLKDAYSVYASPDGKATVNMSGNAALAKGGSGDTLAGTIGGLLCQGMEISRAVALGAFLFGKAAEHAAKKRNMGGILPSELPELYPYILK